MAAGIDKESLESVLDSLKEFARRELNDEKLLAWDRKDEVPLDVIRRMYGSELGIQLLFVPAEYSGLGGSTFDVYRTCEALAHVDLGMATSVLATFLGSDPISVGGTPEQKQLWLTKIAEEGALVAYGATEPSAGSDLGALKTTATPVEKDGAVVGYRISGSKQWISNGNIADFYTILASTPGGPTWFVVEKGAPGFSAGRQEEKHGIRLSNTAPLTLDDVYVDADRLVGGVEGQGLLQAQAVFGYTRVMVASFGLGAGWGALDRAIPYSMERIQGGGPLSEKQGYTHKLIVPRVAQLEAGRSYVEETCELIDATHGMQGQYNTEGAIAKYMCSEAGNAAAEASIQALGGYGYTHEYMVEKYKRDVRITTIYEGTSEILEMTIARDRWQLHLKTRGQYYAERARELDAVHAKDPKVGAAIASHALRALGELLERCRSARLTRHQHVLLRLGELIAFAECAGSFAKRAAAAAAGTRNPKHDARFDAETLAALSRVFARDALMKVVSDGLRWVAGAGGLADGQVAQLATAIDLDGAWRAQIGLVEDMDVAADALYGRARRAS
ncbi:MAG: acyl-CoA dehydrogenase family protein [Deltaproteobacteria bacterium]|nr:acyl-CoA dehydrogenase family protein [Deltaproteobacteria bacterium]